MSVFFWERGAFTHLILCCNEQIIGGQYPQWNLYFVLNRTKLFLMHWRRRPWGGGICPIRYKKKYFSGTKSHIGLTLGSEFKFVHWLEIYPRISLTGSVPGAMVQFAVHEMKFHESSLDHIIVPKYPKEIYKIFKGARKSLM